MQTQLTVQCAPDLRAKKHLLPFLVVNLLLTLGLFFCIVKLMLIIMQMCLQPTAGQKRQRTTALLQTQKRVAFLWAAAMQKH